MPPHDSVPDPPVDPPPDRRSDAALHAAYAAGDEAAFAALYHRHKSWALAVARRFSADGDAALDVLQEAFAYLVRSADRVVLRGELRPFLYPVLRRSARDRRARDARARPLEDAPEPEVLPGLPDEVREYFRGLGPVQQEVLALRFADGLELQEIADCLDVPLGTVKSRLHNALRALREIRPEE